LGSKQDVWKVLSVRVFVILIFIEDMSCGVAHVVKVLPSEFETLSSNPSTSKKEKNKEILHL
jgi:hypothetical protein